MGAVKRLAKAKIRELHVAIFIQQEVVGFYISVKIMVAKAKCKSQLYQVKNVIHIKTLQFLLTTLVKMSPTGEYQPVNVVMSMNRLYGQNTLSNVKSSNSFGQSFFSYEQSHHVTTRKIFHN